MSGPQILRAEPRPLAAVRTRAFAGNIGPQIGAGLGKIWPMLRARDYGPLGHSVVVYHHGEGGSFQTPDGIPVDIGVEVGKPFADHDGVVACSTPAGEVATMTHVGPYQDLGVSYDILARFVTAQGRKRSGVLWEVYGDHGPDPAKLETDIFYLLEPAK